MSVDSELALITKDLEKLMEPKQAVISRCDVPDVDTSTPFKCVDEAEFDKVLSNRKDAAIKNLDNINKIDLQKELNKNLGDTMVIAEGCVDEAVSIIDDIKNMVKIEYDKFQSYHDQMRTVVPDTMASFLYAEFYATAIIRAEYEIGKSVKSPINPQGHLTVTSGDNNSAVPPSTNPALIPDYVKAFETAMVTKPITTQETFPQTLFNNWNDKIKQAQKSPQNYLITKYTTLEVGYTNSSLMGGFYAGTQATSAQIEQYASTTDFKEKIKKNIYEVFQDLSPIEGPDIYKWQSAIGQNNYTGTNSISYLKPPIMNGPDLAVLSSGMKSFIIDVPSQPSAEEAKDYMNIRQAAFIRYLTEIQDRLEPKRVPIYEVVNTAFRREVIQASVKLQSEHFALLKQHMAIFYGGLEKIQWYLNFYNKKYLEDLVNAKLEAATICGQKIPLDKTTDSSAVAINTNKITFSDYVDLANLTKIKYWKRYSLYLNLVGLIPTNWTTGLVAGGTPIKLPILWQPLTVIKTPKSVLVLFITYNGVLVFPVLYEFNADFNANNPSTLKTLYRGSNTNIKMGTGSEALQNPVGNVVAPLVGTKYLMSKDDLPTPERMDLTNPAYLKYLNDWYQAAVLAHGLTP